MICPYQIWGMHVIRRDPLVFTVGKTFPFDQILQLPILPEEAVIQNTFDFLFFFPINQIRRRSRKVRSVGRSFGVWS